MTKTCSVAGCKTNYQKKEDGKITITNPRSVFIFPDEEKKSELWQKWVRFCNNSGICEHHFDKKFIKHGARKRLFWENEDPMPNGANTNLLHFYQQHKQQEVLQPTNINQLNDFHQNDLMKSLVDITDAVCPTGYKREVNEKAVIFLYKLELTEKNHNIPQVTETIVIDEMLHVKLYTTLEMLTSQTQRTFPGRYSTNYKTSSKKNWDVPKFSLGMIRYA